MEDRQELTEEAAAKVAAWLRAQEKKLAPQIEADRAIRAAGFDPLSPAIRRRYGRLKILQLRDVLVRPSSPRIHVPVRRFEEHRPAGRRPRTSARARAPARPSPDRPRLAARAA